MIQEPHSEACATKTSTGTTTTHAPRIASARRRDPSACAGSEVTVAPGTSPDRTARRSIPRSSVAALDRDRRQLASRLAFGGVQREAGALRVDAGGHAVATRHLHRAAGHLTVVLAHPRQRPVEVVDVRVV